MNEEQARSDIRYEVIRITTLPKDTICYNKWYVCLRFQHLYSSGVVPTGQVPVNYYLHSDGIWRRSTARSGRRKDNIFSGYFDTKKQAQRCLSKNHFKGTIVFEEDPYWTLDYPYIDDTGDLE